MIDPRASYRLQFRPGFGFAEAAKIIPYLADLGVSHVYASPVFQARPGSPHGYDVCDPNRLNPELGGREEFERLTDLCRVHGLGWIQDIVPNHMAFHGDNVFLADAFEHGPHSVYRDFFDIDWNHHAPGMSGRVLAPFLGDVYGNILEAGELSLGVDASGLHARYYELRLPLRMKSYRTLMLRGVALAPRESERWNLTELIDAVVALRSESDPARRAEDVRKIKAILMECNDCDCSPLAAALEEINAPENRRSLHRILEEQHFRLCHWKLGHQEINYRRFFTINELICLRMERDEVFDAWHGLILEFLDKGLITGLRIDHIDGLAEPKAYLDRLRERVGPEVPIWVEKILVGAEELPADWPVEGTTGYDFLNHALGLMVDPGAEHAFTEAYRGFAADQSPMELRECESKRLILKTEMAGDLVNVARILKAAMALDPVGRDIPAARLTQAAEELLCRLPVYRAGYAGEKVSLEEARTKAGEARPDLAETVNRLVRRLSGDLGQEADAACRRAWAHAATRFGQLSGPLMAKGVEDTLFYANARYLCLNEVGADPHAFGLAPSEAMRRIEKRAADWPLAMNATATHDTKRGEDARMRLAALSGLGEDWLVTAGRFEELVRGFGDDAPHPEDTFFVFQTLLGAWPELQPESDYWERLGAYIEKSLREAKVRSNWSAPDGDYEERVKSFARELYEHPRFQADFAPLADRLTWAGWTCSLAQMVLKIAGPGLPDIYQGAELWDYSFVDPDNRRPVDFAERARHLAELDERFAAASEALAAELGANPADGRIKLLVMRRLLAARQNDPDLFARGEFRSVSFRGHEAARLAGFARRREERAVLAVVARRPLGLVETGFPTGEAWGDAVLSVPQSVQGAAWTDLLTGRGFPAGGEIGISELFGVLPAAVLVIR